MARKSPLILSRYLLLFSVLYKTIGAFLDCHQERNLASHGKRKSRNKSTNQLEARSVQPIATPSAGKSTRCPRPIVIGFLFAFNWLKKKISFNPFLLESVQIF